MKVQVGRVSAYVQEVLCWTRLNRKLIERSRCVLSDFINQARIEKGEGYSCETSLMKFLIIFCSYQADFRRVRAHGLSNYVQHISQHYLRNWWIECLPEDFKCHYL